MKIIFSQYFETGYFLDYSRPENKTLFDIKICGHIGLLEVLERITGYSGNYPNEMERKLAYHEILSQYHKKKETIFTKAFKLDPVGVSEELLRYRDQLVLAQWGKDSQDISAKIDTLREIEKQFNVPPGLEDRYRRILKEIQGKELSSAVSSIEIFENREDLHPFYKVLFETLSHSKIQILYNELPSSVNDETQLKELKNILVSGGENSSLDTKLKDVFHILKFKTDIDAAHFFAEQDLKGPGTVVINTDNRVFDSVLNSFGKPVSGSVQHDANSTIIQLFKLSASLFTNPLNIYNYMAYLQAPIHPLNHSLRSAFLNHIISKGGTDLKEFIQKIADFKFKSTKESEEQSYFSLPKSYDSEALSNEDLVKFYKALSGWAIKYVHSRDDLADEVKKQLRHLSALCDLLVKALKSTGKDEISQDEFLQLNQGIYESVDVTLETSEVDSAFVVSNPGQLINDSKHLIWLDFYNHEIKPAWYDFLSRSEKEKVDPHKDKIWESESQAASVIHACLRAVLRCSGKLCLVIAEKAGDKKCSEHPFHSLLKAKISNLDDFSIPVSLPEKCDIPGWIKPNYLEECRILLPQKNNIHQITKGNFIQPRRTESYSSSDLLIHYPFDWVFQYAMCIKPGYTYDLGDVETTMGNVAHHFIHDLILSNDYDPDRITSRIQSHYKDDLQAALNNYGALLLLDENRFELSRLTEQLKKSIEVLLGIIKENRLEIKGTEQNMVDSLPGQDGQKYTGDIDLLLEDQEGHQVIFDLKWTRKISKYFSKLKDGKAIQLALYKELVSISQRTSVEKTAFYLLSDAILLSTYGFEEGDVREITSSFDDAEVGRRILNSMKFRMEQLSRGEIEDGEGSGKEEINYYKEPGYDERISLDLDGKKQKQNYYSKFKVFKGIYN